MQVIGHVWITGPAQLGKIAIMQAAGGFDFDLARAIHRGHHPYLACKHVPLDSEFVCLLAYWGDG